jgi:hypothetical protein
MSATATGHRVLELGTLRVEIVLAPLSIHVRRAGRRLLRGLTVWACEGEVRDRFVQVTEGVIADERLGSPSARWRPPSRRPTSAPRRSR